MTFDRAKASLSMLGLVTAACFALADTPAKSDPGADDKEVVKSSGTRRQPATAVSFSQQLNLPFESLGTLGARVDAARRAHDPVALANAAHELAVAEKVAGKKATITSPLLIKEAAQLAKMRRKEKELQAVLKVSEEMQSDADDIASLNDTIAIAKQAIASDQQAANASLEPTWSPRTIVVNNYTSQYLDIWVNGNYKVQVAPGMQQTFYVEHRWNPTILTAYGNDDSFTWPSRYVWGRYKKYTWNID
jgi:hypothetical protein